MPETQTPYRTDTYASNGGNSSAVATMVECDPKKCQEAYRAASELFRQNPDWVSFYRQVLGVGGVVRQLYPTQEACTAFEQTKEYEEIQRMLAKLREQSNGKQPSAQFEPTRVITVRLPKSLHESLRAEAHEKHTSMNKLCISKLVQFIDNELVPTE